MEVAVDARNQDCLLFLHRIAVAALIVPLVALSGSTSGEDALQVGLAKPILSPDQSFTEALAYTERRLRIMPPLVSREQFQDFVETTRRELFEQVIFRGAASEWRRSPATVEYLETIPHEQEGYVLKKLRFEALPGMWIPALLYIPWHLHQQAPETLRVPVALNVNGHDRLGKAAVYKQVRCLNLVKRGMIAMNLEWFGMGQLRSPGFSHSRLHQLDLCGASGLAPFYLLLERGLDVLLEQPHADKDRVAVAGLSGGGWQTILISALDPRVTLSNPVAGYSSFITRIHHHTDLGDSEQTPTDFGAWADYTHLTAMRAPRPTLLTYNEKDDCCFATAHALPPLLAAAEPAFALFDRGANLQKHNNVDPGNHNFEKDNREAFYRMLAEHFARDDFAIAADEIDVSAEVRTAEELQVAMPEKNADFHTLALQLAQHLPRASVPPDDPKLLEDWRERRRTDLRRLVAWEHQTPQAVLVDSQMLDPWKVSRWKIRLANEWTIPVVELSPENPRRTLLLFGEQGRAQLAELARQALEQGTRVLVFDPFYFGECRVQQRDYLAALLLGTVGRRPLGIQAGQVLAVATWAGQTQTVDLITVGPRAGLIGLVARAIDPSRFHAYDPQDGPTTLRQVLDDDLSFEQRPEWFCFGLLEQFEIAHLKQLGE
jgi:hypothetical protein